MSRCRPHIIWQSQDGTWNLGIFQITIDYEGAPYDDSKFEYAFVGSSDDAVTDSCRREFGNFGSWNYCTPDETEWIHLYEGFLDTLRRRSPRDVKRV